MVVRKWEHAGMTCCIRHGSLSVPCGYVRVPEGTRRAVLRLGPATRACDSDTAENVRLIVGRVIDEMERHVSGVEGSEDSPVASWARELRAALGATVSRHESDGVADVSVSAYDLLPQEERDAIAWVREHGGLERVKAQRRESMPRAAYERKKAGFLGHIAECETALGRRNERISELEERVRVREHANDELNEELNAMRPRLMPEGMDWPTVDGEPVVIGERMRSCGIDDCKVVGIDPGNSRLILASDNIEEGKATYFTDFAECCHRPAPKVLDADGAEIRAGDRVWSTQLDEPHEWIVIDPHGDRDDSQTVLVSIGDRTGHARPENLTHRAPVLAADGRPLREGDHVWHVKTGREYVVVEPSYGDTVVVRLAKYDDAEGEQYAPDQLTHERPDSWERIEENARSCTCVMEAIGLVRRARALAERERGE